MATEPCIACGGAYYGTRRDFPLCKEHWDETAAIERVEAAASSSFERHLQQQEFQRIYTRIPITEHRVAPPDVLPEETEDTRLFTIIARFLNYSFKDIAFKYSELTPMEQKLCTKQEWDTLLMPWFKKYREEKKRVVD
jgi:hypothetical protein